MLFLAEFHFGPRGGGPMVAARWQHGPTPGIKVLGAWVSTVSWGNTPDAGLEAGRTYVVFEADDAEVVGPFTAYLQLVCSHIEIRPVMDYLPFVRAFEARDPEQYPNYPPGMTPEARRRQVEQFRQYIAAPNAAEAVRLWEQGPAAAVAVATAQARRYERS
ncbi:MAG: hypothetical protein HYY02_04880 [Chloroflexi bacterium]|nr:hypothetical protein [Chloroflexota bacterium]